MSGYLFTSERLGFRNWTLSDLDAYTEITTDHDVMKYFPSISNRELTEKFIIRMQEQHSKTGFCYFAVERLDEKKLIGFIGLCEQTYDSHFTPCVDIGWRLKKSEWGKGLATEGAKRCLDFAFEIKNLHKIYAVASEINLASIAIMKKIGMTYHSTFDHSLLLENSRIKSCVLYVKEWI
ncbi:MAG: RimJ/RimL family protein N-acetyltransferase [Patiriisocius sp.]|jgi:RimJ/RimL family protein N-acetyltransferase